MTEHFKYNAQRHPSKHIVFRNECSGCGKPLRRSGKSKIGFLCKECGGDKTHGYDEHNSGCYYCAFEEECTIRVELGLWVRCEVPDNADLERLKFIGGLDNDDINEEVEMSLLGSGNRRKLEEYIAKNAPGIYQRIVDGNKTQMCVGLVEADKATILI